MIAHNKRRYSRMTCKEIDRLDCAYIAGLLDADGNIRINKQQTINGSTRYTMTARIANTDARLIMYLIDTVGGGVSEMKSSERKRICYGWSICAVAAYEFLYQIAPFLVSKKEEAEIAMLFQSRRGAVGKHKTAIEKEVDEILYSRCKDLKQERPTTISRGGVLS